MHTFQVSSHVNESGVLSIKLPKEWAEQDVNVLLVQEPLQHKESLAAAFDLLAEMPEDFMSHYQDSLPQARGDGL